MKLPGLIGKKVGMTSVFSVEGKSIPCTVIELSLIHIFPEKYLLSGKCEKYLLILPGEEEADESLEQERTAGKLEQLHDSLLLGITQWVE